MMNGKLPFSLAQKTSVTPEENRKRLITEINEGIAAKQQKTLMTCSNLFRNLILKMLEPNPRKRLSISQVKIHAWIFSTASIDFTEPDNDWITSTINKMSRESFYTTAEISSQIERNPFGTMGGIYNIRKHQYQICKYNMSQSLCKLKSLTTHTNNQLKKPVLMIEKADPNDLHLNRTIISTTQNSDAAKTHDANIKNSIEIANYKPKKSSYDVKNKLSVIRQADMHQPSKSSERSSNQTKVSATKPIIGSQQHQQQNAKLSHLRKIKKISSTSIKGIFRKNILKPVTKTISIVRITKRDTEMNCKNQLMNNKTTTVATPLAMNNDNCIGNRPIDIILKTTKRKECSDLKTSYENFRQKFGSGMPVHTAARAAYRNRNLQLNEKPALNDGKDLTQTYQNFSFIKKRKYRRYISRVRCFS